MNKLLIILTYVLCLFTTGINSSNSSLELDVKERTQIYSDEEGKQLDQGKVQHRLSSFTRSVSRTADERISSPIADFNISPKTLIKEKKVLINLNNNYISNRIYSIN